MRRRFLWVLWFSPFCSTEDLQLPETFIWWQGEKPVADEEEEIDFGNERDAEESDISFSWFLQQEHGEAVNQSLGFLTSEIKAKRGSEANNEKLRQKYFGGEGKALLQHLYCASCFPLQLYVANLFPAPTQGNILITGSEAGSLVKEVLTPEQHFYLHGSTNIDLHIAHGMQRDFSD